MEGSPRLSVVSREWKSPILDPSNAERIDWIQDDPTTRVLTAPGFQPQQASLRSLEAARFVEAPQALLVIYVQPFGAAVTGPRCCPQHEPAADAPPMQVWVYPGVQHEGMNPSIPGRVDEADRTPPSICTAVGKAALQNGDEISRRVLAPRRSESPVEFVGGLAR